MRLFPLIPGVLLSVVVICATPAATRVAAAGDKEMTAEEWKEGERDFAKLKRDGAQFRQTIAVAQMALGAFGFGTGPFDGVLDAKTQSALRNYQRVRALPQSGDLDARTFMKLFQDLELWQRSAPYLPPLFVSDTFWDQGVAVAKGTWTIVGEKSGRPIQTSEIRCEKARGLCFEATAFLTIDKNPGFLSVETTTYEIERWDVHEIVTKPQQTAICARYTMRIGRAQKSVTGLRLRTSTDDFCKDLAAELRLKMVDGGSEVWKAFKADRDKELGVLLQIPKNVFGKGSQ